MTESNASPATPIWARPEPAARQPRFSREQIAAAALEIADAEGFESVSMRRIAARLGAGTMSLYRYIATKDDLIGLLDDALLGEALVPDGELPASWQDAVAVVVRRTRATLLRHPWAAHALRGAAGTHGGMAGPNATRHLEQSLTALAAAPMDSVGKLELLAILDDYVTGHALRAARPLAPGGPDHLSARFEHGLRLLVDGLAAELGPGRHS
jgi:AcrR family transcriptional regulator